MKVIGNIIWIIFGGLELAAGWLLAGLVCCITIVGIPLGRQCFKFASLSLTPFGKEIDYGGGIPSVFANILWMLFIGIPMALANFIVGIIWCITIIGIPFGTQAFKMAKLSLFPFGAKVR